LLVREVGCVVVVGCLRWCVGIVREVREIREFREVALQYGRPNP
jgi:hypothetical protein